MNIPVLLGLTWTQATPPRNWQHITNDIHKGQHKPNFPSSSWLNPSCSWLLHRAIWKWSLLIAWSRQISQISAKAEAFNEIYWSRFRQQQHSWVPI